MWKGILCFENFIDEIRVKLARFVLEAKGEYAFSL